MNAPRPTLRLTDFAHGGGCGCKIAPGLLRQILSKSAGGVLPKQLLVGIETADDAAVYQINDTQAIVATTDFFTPVVDDPFDCGRIAATNAISDVYAMGGTPLFAPALVGMPIDNLPADTIRLNLQGGESVCTAAGIPVAGGHSIDSVEPIYGLVAIGLVDPKHIKRNADAQPGDLLIPGKGLGVGIYSAALKQQQLPAAHYAAMIASTTGLNTPGPTLAPMAGVHALTDVTGFGLLGHLLEVCRGSGVAATLHLERVPLLHGVADLLAGGFKTSASTRNRAGYGEAVDLGAHGERERTLLTDPQTSGGLLVSCAPDAPDAVLEVFRAEGFGQAAVIGEFTAGEPRVQVR